MSRKARVYISFTLLFTLIFSLIAAIFIGITWVNRVLYGDLADLQNTTMQKSYVNTLLCGVDKEGYRTDVLILAHLNLIDNSLTLVQIPRDTYVENNGRSDKKINSAYGYNKETQLFKEVHQILPGVEVDKFILVDLQGFRDIIDAIGGVEYNVPIDMDYDDPEQDLHIHLKQGPQKLDGNKAEQLVRFRKDNNEVDIQTLTNGKYSRTGIQREFISTTIDQILDLKNVMKAPEFVSIATDNVTTNFEYDDFLTYAPIILSINPDSIRIMELPGEDTNALGPWYFINDKAATAQMIQEYLTPERAEISTQELAIRNQLIGNNSQMLTVPANLELKKNFGNGFLSVDVIDGSGGTANIDKIVADIEAYGFNVKSVDKAATVRFEQTVVVAKKDNGDGAKIAKAIGLSNYLVNAEKRTGTSVTIIVGSDMK
ncbi:MAG: LCP family protein [Clostridia bacterium]|nr:LCP family protein [Clostridia bacterium]